MKKLVLVNGLIAGAITAIALVVSMAIHKSTGNFNHGMVFGYASMLLAFSLIFVGIKNYRDKHNLGTITFGQAFKIGILISLIASTIYVITWLVEYYFFFPNFSEKYAEAAITQLKTDGASAEKIEATTKEMAEFIKMYKNPFVVILFTFAEILPVGIVVTLISALILKKKTS